MKKLAFVALCAGVLLMGTPAEAQTELTNINMAAECYRLNDTACALIGRWMTRCTFYNYSNGYWGASEDCRRIDDVFRAPLEDPSGNIMN